MDEFGGDSPLSEAPSSTSQTGSTGTNQPVRSPSPVKLKLKTTKKKQPIPESASSSRRSSRNEERSSSPEKPPTPGVSSIKLKFSRPPSPEKLAEIAEEAEAGQAGQVEEKGKRGKKRKSDGAQEMREEMKKGKKVKVSHEAPRLDMEEGLEPKKKNIATKKNHSAIGGVEKSTTDMIFDLFGDDDDDDDGEEVKEGIVEETEVVVKEKEKKGKKQEKGKEEVKAKEKEKEKEVIKPVIRIKGKPGPKPKAKVEEDKDGDFQMDVDGDEGLTEKLPKSAQPSDSKSRRGDEEGKLETEVLVKSTSTSRKIKRDPIEEKTSDEPAVEAEKPVVSVLPKARGRPKKSTQDQYPSTSTSSSSARKEIKPVESTPATGIDTETTKDDQNQAHTVKTKKSFAQAVAGSPPTAHREREKKPLPTITKLTKSVSAGTPTPDKRISSIGSGAGSGSGAGTGTNTPTAAKKMVPVQKKKEVSLLESTMASLLGGGTGTVKSTPKKDVSLVLFI